MEVKTPKEFCEAYFVAVYGDQELPNEQKLEVSLAFHAGMEGTGRFIHDYIADGDEAVSDEERVRRLARFRRTNRARASHLNMTRYGNMES